MQLLPISQKTIGNGLIQTVDARELHAALGVGRDFSNWIKVRIAAYGFIENIDFTVFANSGENPSGGRPMVDYAISLDMAKELAMVERTQKGREVRRYFIECERRLKEIESAGIAKITRRLERLEALVASEAFPRSIPALSASERVRNKILKALAESPKGRVYLRAIQRSVGGCNKDRILEVANSMKIRGEIAAKFERVSGGVRVYFVSN